MKQWVIGGPECPIRMVFRSGAHPGMVTLKVFDVQTGEVLLPHNPMLKNRAAIGFTTEQCRTMVEIFQSALEPDKKI